MYNMTARDRLKAYLSYKKIKDSEFIEAIGASNGYIQSMSKGFGPKYEPVVRQKFPDLNIGWIITGFGEMINDGNKPEENNTNQLNPNTMDMSFVMDYIDTLKKQLDVKDDQIKEMAEEKRANTKLLEQMANLLTELGVDKSLSRRLGAVKEKQDELDY